MAERERERPLVRRRSSFGRALERMRDALNRRRSRGAEGMLLQSTREDEANTAAPAPAVARELPAEAVLRDDPPVTETKAVVPGESMADSHLVPDDGDEDAFSANEEPLEPAFANRTGVNEEKARALFERYGLKYPPRTLAQTAASAAANKIRRVEKPVRIRIHWTCHECQRQFGHDRACTHCGHRRCNQCPRSPPKKVKAMSEEARRAQLLAREPPSADKSQILAAIAPNTVASPPRTQATAEPGLNADDEDDAATAPQYVIEQRPSSGVKLVLQPKGNAQFQPTMVATVQRVYRKPRQRVRWKCEKCDTMFTEGRRCRTCDHERCEECVRTPAKRPPSQPDPAVIQSVTDKLAAWDLSRTRTQRGPDPS